MSIDAVDENRSIKEHLAIAAIFVRCDAKGIFFKICSSR